MNKCRFSFLLFVFFLGAVFACFNVEFAPTFHVDRYPADAQAFIEGNPGVIQSSFYHFYLFAAYRHLSGLGLTETEQKSLGPGFYRTVEPYEPYGYDKWREKVLKIGYREYTGTFKIIREGGYQHFVNCPDESYETAMQTLEDRSRRFGADSEAVRLWLEGQKQVFSNCGGGSVIPNPLTEGVDPIIRADREYQIACAHFYSGHFDEAATRFERIAADPGSSWNKWGRYLAARCYIRKGTLIEGQGQIDRKSLEEAILRLEQVRADPGLESLHPAALRLLNYIRVRLDPQKHFQEVARVVMAAKPGEAIGQAWIDFDYLLDRGFKPESETDLWTWLHAMRGQGQALQTSLERWRATGAPHWLVAAIGPITADHPAAGELIEAATRLPVSSPAYLTVTYHRFRLAFEKGREKQVRGELDRLIDDADRKMPPDSRNLFLGLRFRLLGSFEEFLKYAPREPVHKGFVGAREGSDKYLDKDSLVIFNTGLPLTLLEEAVKRPTLPVPIRQELALAAWSRAVLIGESHAARRLSEKVKEHWPELKGDLARYGSAGDEASRRFSVVWTLLRHPGAQPYLRASLHRQTPIDQIDQLRENWWCGFHEGESMHEAGYVKRNHIEIRRNSPQYANALHPREGHGTPPVAFLTPAERQAVLGELNRLRAVPAGPDFLCQETLKWARAHPKDPRVPEALHLAVKATRFGCESANTTDSSRRAFQFLHRNYPSSEWTKATPYWY